MTQDMAQDMAEDDVSLPSEICSDTASLDVPLDVDTDDDVPDLEASDDEFIPPLEASDDEAENKENCPPESCSPIKLPDDVCKCRECGGVRLCSLQTVDEVFLSHHREPSYLCSRITWFQLLCSCAPVPLDCAAAVARWVRQ